MKRRRRLTLAPLLALILALLLAPLGVAAQGAGDATGAAPCPAGFACVEHEGHVFEVDKADGAIQGFVVSLSETTTETLDGVTTERSGTAVWFAASGGSYAVAAEDVPITAAQAAVAEAGEALVAHLAEGRG